MSSEGPVREHIKYAFQAYYYLALDGFRAIQTKSSWRDKFFIGVFLLWTLAVLGDAGTTYFFITIHDGRELNPVANFMFANLGLPGALIVGTFLTLFFVFLSLARPRDTNDYILMFPAFFILFFKLFAVVNNIYWFTKV